MKIAVAGTGYVGLSIAVLFAQKHEVFALDVIEEKVDLINKRISPIGDDDIERFFAEKELNLTATLSPKEAYEGAKYVVISTPTDYDEEKNFFDTSSVEKVIEDVLEINPDAIMMIKSTVPVGYTLKMREKYNTDKLIFSPEFLLNLTHTLSLRASIRSKLLKGLGLIHELVVIIITRHLVLVATACRKIRNSF